MTKFVFCSEVPEEMLEDLEGCNFPCNDEGVFYEYMVAVEDDMVNLFDSIGRSVPIDITQIDQVIDALITARGLMLTPNLPDTYVQSDMGC